MSARKGIDSKTYFDTWVSAGMSYAKAADVLGVVPAAVRMGVLKYKRDTGDQTQRPAWMPPAAIAAHSQAPEGYFVKGVSTYYGEDGDVKGQWVKTTADQEALRQAQEAAYETLSQDLPRLEPTAPPAATLARLCNLYTMTDCHVGMLAWHREGGADWDLKIAEDTLSNTFLQMIASAPPARVGIVNQLGDFLHTDGLVPLTPTSKNVLDADSRYQKMVKVAIRILRRIISAALAKHEIVRVYMHEGNHDVAGSVWLRVMFAALYENEPRLSVEESPLPYVAYQHGKTMLCFHHGHMSKNDSLPLLFAAKFPQMWGATEKRYIHVGHRHHVDEKEHPGVKVIQHPTIAAADAYAARGGWISERQATSMTYHETYGEHARGIFVPEMAA